MLENKEKIDLKNKCVFITGVAGFIGSNLAKRLLKEVEGVKVIGPTPARCIISFFS